VTLPARDTQSRRTLSRRPRIVSPDHSMPETNPVSPPSAPSNPPPVVALTSSYPVDHEHALDFATHSWDLATGGLKTLTAKQELPLRSERRSTGVVPDILATSRSYMFVLVIVGSMVLMLVGVSIVLFVMLQP
jgi:hypothetical protein